MAEWQDGHGAWHSKIVRSYGIGTPEAAAQAEADLQDLKRLALDDSAPIPMGMLSDAVWSGLEATVRNPIGAVPFLPLLAARDLIHLGAYVIAQTTGDLGNKVSVTQSHMEDEERARFLEWLGRFSAEDQASILAFQWSYPPVDPM